MDNIINLMPYDTQQHSGYKSVEYVFAEQIMDEGVNDQRPKGSIKIKQMIDLYRRGQRFFWLASKNHLTFKEFIANGKIYKGRVIDDFMFIYIQTVDKRLNDNIILHPGYTKSIKDSNLIDQTPYNDWYIFDNHDDAYFHRYGEYPVKNDDIAEVADKRLIDLTD